MCVSYQPLLSNRSDTYMNRNFLCVIPSRLYYHQGKKNLTVDMILEDLALQSRRLFYEGERIQIHQRFIGSCEQHPARSCGKLPAFQGMQLA